jgi:hypothetical protein
VDERREAVSDRRLAVHQNPILEIQILEIPSLKMSVSEEIIFCSARNDNAT